MGTSGSKGTAPRGLDPGPGSKIGFWSSEDAIWSSSKCGGYLISLGSGMGLPRGGPSSSLGSIRCSMLRVLVVLRGLGLGLGEGDGEGAVTVIGEDEEV